MIHIYFISFAKICLNLLHVYHLSFKLFPIAFHPCKLQTPQTRERPDGDDAAQQGNARRGFAWGALHFVALSIWIMVYVGKLRDLILIMFPFDQLPKWLINQPSTGVQPYDQTGHIVIVCAFLSVNMFRSWGRLGKGFPFIFQKWDEPLQRDYETWASASDSWFTLAQGDSLYYSFALLNECCFMLFLFRPWKLPFACVASSIRRSGQMSTASNNCKTWPAGRRFDEHASASDLAEASKIQQLKSRIINEAVTWGRG